MLNAFARSPAPQGGFPALAPQEPVFLIGDLHGRLDCLNAALRIRSRHFPQSRLVVLGDMIDRGPQSAEILTLLQRESSQGAICLLGNHEQMMLDALEDDHAAQGWLQHGGLETLASFGLTGPPLSAIPRLPAAMPPGQLDWLRNLPLMWQSGNLVAVHAALRPDFPLDKQPQQVFLWGHPAFMRQSRSDGLWVAHGHIVVPEAGAENGRIALDTGAHATGRLSYAAIDPARPEEGRLVIGVASVA